MAVTRSTLALTRRLRSDVGTEADDADRHLTGSWVSAWDRLAPAWSRAATELAAIATADGAWPNLNRIARNEAAMAALDASRSELDGLAETTGETAAAATERVVQLDAEIEPRIVASQAPEPQQEALESHLRHRLREQEDEEPDVTDGGMMLPPDDDTPLGPIVVAGLIAGRIEPSALAAIIARAQGQIHADTFPLAPAAEEAMKAALIEGVLVGDHPERAARDMVARVEGAFNGGLTRALTISRTEMLDAYRAGSAYIHRANRDLVSAWVWFARLDSRACSACWARHGQIFPVSEPGPDDHPRGRCTRLPKLATWAELGISATEPPSVLPDAQRRFRRLPRADQLQIMGPGRLDLLDSGRITWGDLAAWRENPAWRRSNQPASVRDLTRLADQQEETRVS